MIGIIFFISFLIFIICYVLFVILGEYLLEDGNFKAIWNICFFMVSIAIMLEVLDVYII